MSSLKFQTRRATLDDLSRLQQLWTMMRFTDTDLERQLTDFQVVVDSTGQIVGCLALQIVLRQGRVHSEAFEDFSLAEHARPELWSRIQTLAQNHGLARLWTLEQSPFWSRNGFTVPSEADLGKMAQGWDRTTPGWLTIKLKDEEALASLEKEFALFVESEKQQRANLLSRAKFLKTLAIAGITLIALVFVAGMIWVLLKRNSGGSLPPP